MHPYLEITPRNVLTFNLRQLFVKCMDNGLAIMPAPIFLVTDDPKVTAGLGGDDHLLDVRCPWSIFGSLPAHVHLEGQLPPRHVRRHGTDNDQRVGDPGRNPCSVLQRVNSLQNAISRFGFQRSWDFPNARLLFVVAVPLLALFIPSYVYLVPLVFMRFPVQWTIVRWYVSHVLWTFCRWLFC